ncbi:hypothetical protein CXF68_06335 [Tenacibaculum sp. Bg11-29]|uniref:hypothetical protein n=1 Tax=Tenacibaculum sp. Bg11-29 TaxID=2058306 RepID=UPI000C3254CD|nr:hypothetical protein [Tenacibaculum sp. Bg11-29]PKH50340.1 hypothetical protein CXF68_06335 [Tenacibaculum sp. Bg11-29]
MTILIIVGQIIIPLLEVTANAYIGNYVEISSYVNYAYYFYIFIFWWLAPFTILLIKNYFQHLYYFIAVSIILGIIVLVKSFSHSFDAFLYDLILFIIPTILISIVTYFSQKLIGKKLLPTMYKQH